MQKYKSLTVLNILKIIFFSPNSALFTTFILMHRFEIPWIGFMGLLRFTLRVFLLKIYKDTLVILTSICATVCNIIRFE